MDEAYVQALKTPPAAPAEPRRSAKLRSLTLVVSSLSLWLASCATRVPVDDDVAPTPSAGTPPATSVSRWVAVNWTELPGFQDDRIAQAVPALRRNCDKPLPAWRAVCAELPRLNADDDAATRQWLMSRFDVYRVESLSGQPEGLATGYFEPAFDAAREANATQKFALHRAPSDLATRKPWYTREQADKLPAARAALRGKEIAYVADPLDVLMVQIQGSGRLRITEPDGRASLVRIAFAGHNDQPYQSVGRWLIQQGELRSTDASWNAIRDWARRNPQRLSEMLWANPRLVFFREEPLPDPNIGPRGAQGVPLTPERSIAVDPRSIPYSTPIWLDTFDPTTNAPLRRLVVAQDTGSAIVGAVRADYFWGPGERAEQQASRMKHKLRMWALWPKGGAGRG